MAERLIELKSKRENERRGLVQTLTEKRFRETTDDLRKEDAKFYLKQVAIEREAQMREKRQQLEREVAEESLFARMAQSEIRTLEAREQLGRQQQQRLKQETLGVLDWQKTKNAERKDAEGAAASREQSMLNEQWALESEKASEQVRQQRLLVKESNLELIRHNEVEKQAAETE